MVMRLTELSGLDAFIDDGMHAGIIEDISIDTETGKIEAGADPRGSGGLALLP